MRAILDAHGHVPPGDAPVLFDQNVGGDRDVRVIRPAALMQQAVVLDDLAVDIRQDGERQAVLLDDLARLLRRIDRNGQQPAAATLEFSADFSETSEFCDTGRSPVPAVEDE